MRTLLPRLLCALCGLLAGPARPDLDVALPPGSPLEWTASFPAYTPPPRPLFPATGAGAPEREPQRSSAKLAASEADVRFANAFGTVRILTWDLGAHLPWILTPTPLPTSGRASGLRPPPPVYGEPLYWISLAPLLRLLLHPDALSRAETMAHLVELGEAVLPVLGAATSEPDLAATCRELRALIRVDLGPNPEPPKGATPRESALARLVLEECLRDHPLDPSDDFGRRLFLFAEEAEPWLRAYAQHPSLTLARNAVVALGRYETRSAVEFLAALAARCEDPVTLVRALAALGRYRGPLEVQPLVERLKKTSEPVQRAALIGALGRLGARAAAPTLLELGEHARRERDGDLLLSVLSALARIAWSQPQPEQAAFCLRVASEARELGQRASTKQKPDLPDAPTLRAELLTQLAHLARSQADPLDEKLRATLLTLARAAPRDPRTSEQGVGGSDPLGNLAPYVRFLALEGLLRAGPAGVEQLAALVLAPGLETALRGRALALLPYDRRGPAARALLSAELEPVELRVQALEVLIGDQHEGLDGLCRAQLAHPDLAAARPPAAALFLALRALRQLSERGTLRAQDLLLLYPLVRRPVAERRALVEELRARLTELAQHAQRATKKELETEADGLLDFVLEHELNPLLDPQARAARLTQLLQTLEPARTRRRDEPEDPGLVARLLDVLIGGESELIDPGRRLFQPNVPLAEELLLALGRTREPLAVELLLGVLQRNTRELRAHAALALGMCAQPALAGELLPLLLDQEPFVRFCASESLRHLTERESSIDWLSASAAERQEAAEEWRAWFLRERR